MGSFGDSLREAAIQDVYIYVENQSYIYFSYFHNIAQKTLIQ